MKFKYYIDQDSSVFEAIPENEEETIGYRMEGNYPQLKLVNNKLRMNYVSKEKLHPDIIAAICIFTFYPFINKNITFPYHVSKNFSESLKYDILPKFNKTKIVDEFTILNIDDNLISFKDIPTYNNWSIAFGGGLDSTAIAMILPDIPIVHLKVRDVDEIKKFSETNLNNETYILSSNIKELTQPNGFPLWASCFIGNLLMSCDLKTNKMITGTILGSSCLKNGQGYFNNCCKMTNRFDLFLDKIGVTPIYITGGCSEIITSKIIFENNLTKSVLFCENNNGKPCYKCTKCFRKLVELTYHGADFNFNTFNKEFISKFLKSRYFQHIFIFLCQNYRGDNEIFKFLRNELKEILDKETKFCNKVYSEFYNKYDPTIKEFIINLLKKNNFEIMNDNDVKCLKCFS